MCYHWLSIQCKRIASTASAWTWKQATTFISRDVVFHESVFPYALMSSNSESNSSLPLPCVPAIPSIFDDTLLSNSHSYVTCQDSIIQVHHELDDVPEEPLSLLLILFLLEGLLELLNNHHTSKHIIAIKYHPFSLPILSNQVPLFPRLLMFLISIFPLFTNLYVVPFPLLLSLLFIIKLFLTPNGKRRWLLN